MSWLYSLIPVAQEVLAMEPEELAAVILEYWITHPESANINRYNHGLLYNVDEYPDGLQAELQRALMEAWMILESKALIAPKPGDTGDWYFITRRGRKLRVRKQIEAYLKA
jgi:hypothetical protein